MLQSCSAAVLQWSFDMTSQAGDDDDECHNRAGGAETAGLALPASLRISQQFLPFPLPGPGWPGGGERGWRLEVVQGLAPDKYNKLSIIFSESSLSTSATSPPWSVRWTPGDWHRSSQKTRSLPGERKSVENESSGPERPTLCSPSRETRTLSKEQEQGTWFFVDTNCSVSGTMRDWTGQNY